MRWITGNPTLKRVIKKAERNELHGENGDLMSNEVQGATIKGSVLKSVIFCSIVVLTAIASALLFNHFVKTSSEEGLMFYLFFIVLSSIPMLIISIVLMFAPGAASVLGTIYCILNGILLGAVTALVDLFYPGISFVALIGTCVVFFVAVIIFRLMGNRAGHGFVKGVLIAFISLLVVELLCFFLSFIPAFAAVFSNIWLQLLISGISIIIATLVIIVNLNLIYRLEEYQVDKKYEWLAAFSLTVTLIWVYMEILELLLKVVSITGRRK